MVKTKEEMTLMKKRILLILALLSLLCATMAVAAPVGAKDKLDVYLYELNATPHTYWDGWEPPPGWVLPPGTDHGNVWHNGGGGDPQAAPS